MTIVVCFSFFGCLALFGNEKQYESGDWYLVTGSKEVAKIKQDKLAFEKLKSQNVLTAEKNGVSQGYEGRVCNLTRNIISFEVSGPEKKAWILSPGEKHSDFLIPGVYFYTIKQNNHIVAQSNFTVSSQLHYYLGENIHWGLGWIP